MSLAAPCQVRLSGDHHLQSLRAMPSWYPPASRTWGTGLRPFPCAVPVTRKSQSVEEDRRELTVWRESGRDKAAHTRRRQHHGRLGEAPSVRKGQEVPRGRRTDSHYRSSQTPIVVVHEMSTGGASHPSVTSPGPPGSAPHT